MANPVNPLDDYKSYTYHFELHAAKTWEILEREMDTVSNAVTTPYEANGTLLVNTRFDAHQTIDNVRYMYLDPRVDPTGTTASVAQLTMTLTEPNGTFFIQKLEKMMEDMEITDILKSCHFMLKIIFVGRNADNSVDIDELDPICIPLQLYDISAEFTYRGGTYGLVFIASGAGAITNNFRDKYSLMNGAEGSSHKNVSIRARTVREALEELESALQKNYDESYEALGVDVKGRPIRYEINLDDAINGKLDLVTKDTWSPEDYMKLSFQPEIPIIEMIKRIVMSSKEVNQMISESVQGLRKEFEPGVKYPTYSMRYQLNDDEAVIIYDIHLYEGANNPKGDFEFDYLFATPAGKNVDVISFEMKYTSLLGWLQWSLNNSVSFHTNQDNQTSTEYAAHYGQNIVRPNKTAEKYVDQTPTSVAYQLNLRDSDVKPSSNTNIRENSGHVQLTHEGALAARLAFNTVAEMHGARDPMITFVIRGHYDLLLPCCPRPDGDNLGFGQKDAIWVKVNIKNQDGQEFFYTGYYRLLSVENIFENGQFIQQLTVIMMDRVTSTNGGGASVQPQSNNQQVSSDSRGEANQNATFTDNFGF